MDAIRVTRPPAEADVPSRPMLKDRRGDHRNLSMLKTQFTSVWGSLQKYVSNKTEQIVSQVLAQTEQKECQYLTIKTKNGDEFSGNIFFLAT